jgi:hypothetical protein
MPTLPDLLATLDKLTQELDGSLSAIEAALIGEQPVDGAKQGDVPIWGNLGYLDSIVAHVDRLTRQASGIRSMIAGEENDWGEVETRGEPLHNIPSFLRAGPAGSLSGLGAATMGQQPAGAATATPSPARESVRDSHEDDVRRYLRGGVVGLARRSDPHA